jgi:hypothetical protein
LVPGGRRRIRSGYSEQLAVPAQGLLAVEVAAHDEAAAPAQQRAGLGRHRARRDVGIVDDWPDHLAPFARGGDLVHLGLDLLLDHGEDLVDGAARGGDAGAQRALDLPGRRGQVGRRLFPVRQWGQRGGRARGLGWHSRHSF